MPTGINWKPPEKLHRYGPLAVRDAYCHSQRANTPEEHRRAFAACLEASLRIPEKWPSRSKLLERAEQHRLAAERGLTINLGRPKPREPVILCPNCGVQRRHRAYHKHCWYCGYEYTNRVG